MIFEVANLMEISAKGGEGEKGRGRELNPGRSRGRQDEGPLHYWGFVEKSKF